MLFNSKDSKDRRNVCICVFCEKSCFSKRLSFLKKPSRGALRKRCSKICSKFTGEHPCRNVISVKLLCKFIEITLRHGCFPVNLLHIFGKPFLGTLLDSCLCRLSLISYFLKAAFILVLQTVYITRGTIPGTSPSYYSSTAFP